MGTIQQSQEGLPARQATGGGRARDPSAAQAPAETQVAAPGPSVPVIDPEAARECAQQVQEALERVAPALHEIAFRIDETTNGFVIEVRNPDGSVVRQYPPEKLLNLRRKLDELSGMVIDQVS